MNDSREFGYQLKVEPMKINRVIKNNYQESVSKFIGYNLGRRKKERKGR